jgi:hypothetical protein
MMSNEDTMGKGKEDQVRFRKGKEKRIPEDKFVAW